MIFSLAACSAKEEATAEEAKAETHAEGNADASVNETSTEEPIELHFAWCVDNVDSSQQQYYEYAEAYVEYLNTTRDDIHITPKEIAGQSVDLFYCQEYRFEKKQIEPAKNFKYTNYAYEMFDARGVEIGNISRFLDNDGIGATTFAFGLERLVMHQFETSDIWSCPAFRIAADGEKNGIVLDELRRNIFIKANSIQYRMDKSKLCSTLLPLIHH